jgi:hypothetical protein
MRKCQAEAEAKDRSSILENQKQNFLMKKHVKTTDVAGLEEVAKRKQSNKETDNLFIPGTG